MSKSAIVVIDVQNYFINKHTKNLPEKIREFIERGKFDYVLFTKFINRRNLNFVKIAKWYKCFRSPDIDIHPLLSEFLTKDNVFVKNSFSPFKSRKFVKFLKKNRINDLLICGTDTEACIFSTAIDAFDSGYNVKVLKDLCGSHHGKNFHKMGCKLIESSIEPQKK